MCVYGLEVLCSLGLIQKDCTLAGAVLQELNCVDESKVTHRHKLNAIYNIFFVSVNVITRCSNQHIDTESCTPGTLNDMWL